jgi:hypothetical protein
VIFGDDCRAAEKLLRSFQSPPPGTRSLGFETITHASDARHDHNNRGRAILPLELDPARLHGRVMMIGRLPDLMKRPGCVRL